MEQRLSADSGTAAFLALQNLGSFPPGEDFGSAVQTLQ